MRYFLFFLFLVLVTPFAGAHAQQQVITVGQGNLTSGNLSGTITAAGTYQSLQVLNTNRKACTVQNNGTHTMYVFFGSIGSATHNTSVQLSGGQSVSCNVSGMVLIDQVSVDGTTGDVFFASFQ